jgi:hypothetical protein
MSGAEPIACPSCHRKYTPRFDACPYCKAERPPGPAAQPSDRASGPASVVPASDKGKRESKEIHIVPAQGEEEPSRAPWIAMGGLAFALIVGIVLAGPCNASRADLWVVNTTGKDVAVYVDGDSVLRRVASTQLEAPIAVAHATVSSGPHAIEARWPDGGVASQTRIDVATRSNGFLFAPKHDPALCFGVTETTYGDDAGVGATVPLDRRSDLWELPQPVDRFLEPSPESIKPKPGSLPSDRALRMTACSP